MGADPIEGKGADCLLLAFRVLEEFGYYHPPVDPKWFELAAAKRWYEIEAIFHRHITQIDAPEPCSITLLQNGPAGLGVGTRIDDGLLITHHKKGVIWIPPSALKPLTYYRFKVQP